MQTAQEKFDYLIVGGGSAGAVLAARLSENPTVSVCLIEAGAPDNNPLIHIPFGLSLLGRFRSLGWGYYTAPQAQLYDRELFWPRGKTLGGSSSVNAMCYIRGQNQDYDRWANEGARGWDFEQVLPYFKRSENYYRGADEYHGVGGPLNVDKLRHTCPLTDAFVEAAQSVNLPILDDFNREEREGLGYYDVTQINGQRCSTAKGYLKPATGRNNLTVLTQVMAERVLFRERRAVGVQVRFKGKVRRLYARHEVILSGGAINSPQLLMLSGIGPKEALQEHGILALVDLPGVGQNLQDHLDAIVQFNSQAHEGYAVALSALPQYIKASFDYLFGRKGIFSSNIAEGGGFVRSSLAENGPDIQFHFLPAKLREHGRRSVFGYGFGLHVCCLYPKSRGSITLQSNHPADHPLIDPNYLAEEDDCKVMIEGVRLARQILNSPSFAPFRGKERLPGAQAETDEQILDFIRARSETIYHPIGTCKMGADNDPMAVVDNQLRVRGVSGLRVVDASVMPSLLGGNTNAPTAMIAERAADFIKASHAGVRAPIDD
ncbi:choline dehydrogenase [Alteromonas aestuariivivens]|uniref:Choline dehydrogenase n=1 Tax=Alteromonas aestuariivivens TaxID=1938339 RepID=A0A3D8M4F4_9ALTE|nr:choline dehydrogenase [Alteromonas aestuariivivens]RDV24627.1 choline dehydrogenase [Alteromonas aestuariivivens]